MALLTECLKSKELHWGTAQKHSFELIEQALSIALVLTRPNFSKPFQVGCRCLCIGIGAILAREGHLIEFFS